MHKYLDEYKEKLDYYFYMFVISCFEFDGVNSFFLSKLLSAENAGYISDLTANLRALMCPRRITIKLLIVTLLRDS